MFEVEWHFCKRDSSENFSNLTTRKKSNIKVTPILKSLETTKENLFEKVWLPNDIIPKSKYFGNTCEIDTACLNKGQYYIHNCLKVRRDKQNYSMNDSQELSMGQPAATGS